MTTQNTSREGVVRTYLDFYRERGHEIIEPSGLVRPGDDPVLFTTAGMHPLTPYLRGEPHPSGRRLTDVQRCLRTTDLDRVGNLTHLTVFEMLGTWSLGGYSGERSLRWGYELLTDGFGIDPSMLHVTVFGGNDEVRPDDRSRSVWDEIGVPIEFTGPDNWWDNGPTGPCGPDSEIFYWIGDGIPRGTPMTDDRWVEIDNHVMMRYERRPDGRLVPLGQPNVDTGTGLERLLTVLQGVSSVFECDVFRPWVHEVRRLWDLSGSDLRVVCDHLRSSAVLIGDGVRPSNTRHGYVLRRLIRRCLTVLWRDDPGRSLDDLGPDPVRYSQESLLGHCDPDLVRTVWLDEEQRFRRLVERGRGVVERQLRRGPLTPEDYRYLHDTHGLPPDLVNGLWT